MNKQYHIFNQRYSKEEYQKFINSSEIGSFQAHLEFLQKLKELELKAIHRYARVYKSVNSDGDDLYESRNTHMSFHPAKLKIQSFYFLPEIMSKIVMTILFKDSTANESMKSPMASVAIT